MTTPAVAALAILLVTPNTTNTNSAVRITSARKAPPALMWIIDSLPYPSAPRPSTDLWYRGDWLKTAHNSRAPRIPPANWATM